MRSVRDELICGEVSAREYLSASAHTPRHGPGRDAEVLAHGRERKAPVSDQ